MPWVGFYLLLNLVVLELGGACAVFLAQQTCGTHLFRGESLGLLELDDVLILLQLIFLLLEELVLLKADVANEVFVGVEVWLVEAVAEGLRGAGRRGQWRQTAAGAGLTF